MQKKDIIFLGLAQSCEKHINKFLDLAYEISLEKNIHVFIGENGSNDFTFDVISKSKLNDIGILTFIDTTFIEKFNDRIERLANARQRLKNSILNKNLIADYVCVVDLDDVLNKNFNKELIFDLLNNLKKNFTKYFAISVKSEPFYYDILNFESFEFPNRQVKQLQNNKKISSYNLRKKNIYDVQKKISKLNDIKAISAFNGLCIYNFNEFISSDYLENSQDVTPEHLFLNRQIHTNTNKTILITENKLKMPDEHKPLNNFFIFIMEKLKKYLIILFQKFFK